jgi:hypothetical protein
VLRALELVPLVLVMFCQSTRSVQIAVSAHGSARHACRTFATGCTVTATLAVVVSVLFCSQHSRCYYTQGAATRDVVDTSNSMHAYVCYQCTQQVAVRTLHERGLNRLAMSSPPTASCRLRIASRHRQLSQDKANMEVGWSPGAKHNGRSCYVHNVNKHTSNYSRHLEIHARISRVWHTTSTLPHFESLNVVKSFAH